MKPDIEIAMVSMALAKTISANERNQDVNHFSTFIESFAKKAQFT